MWACHHGLEVTYILKAPALAGSFYCFNRLTNPFNQHSTPGNIARTYRAFLLDTDITADCCYDKAVAPHLPMSEEQLNAFIAKVQGDSSLQEQLKAAATADVVVAIAKEEGFSISVDDVKNARTELSDEELEGLAGGHDCFSDGADTYC